MAQSQQDSKSLSTQRYNQFAQGYVESKTHAQGADLDRLVEIAQPQPQWRGLDIATGGGHTALKFSAYVQHIIATDIAEKMLNAAQNHIAQQGVENIDFQLADAENLPFEAHKFDLITCRIAPHHFPDVPRFVAECARVLKKGGVLIVQDHVISETAEVATYAEDFERLRDPSHHRAYSESEWREMFENTGLVVYHTEQLTKCHDFVPWVKRQGNSEEVLQQLQAMLHNASPAEAEWLDATDIGTPQATFVNHHLIIAGRKP